MSKTIWVQSFQFQELWDGTRNYFLEESTHGIKPWEVVLFQEVDASVKGITRDLKPTGRELYTNATHVTKYNGVIGAYNLYVFQFRVWKKIDPKTLPDKRRPSL